MKYICVFCSASEIDKTYIKPAVEFGKLLVAHHYGLVYGASEKGLMKILADTVQQAGGKVIGISTEVFRSVARQTCDELVVTRDLSERKALLLSRSDAIVLMVGGVGSVDEVTEILELKKQGSHKKPIVVLNTNNFYEGLKMQLERMKHEGFIAKDLDELIFFAQTPSEAIEYIDKEL